MKQERRFIRDTDLARRWDVSSMFIWRHERSDPDFPPKYQFGTRMNARSLDDVEAYEDARRRKTEVAMRAPPNEKPATPVCGRGDGPEPRSLLYTPENNEPDESLQAPATLGGEP